MNQFKTRFLELLKDIYAAEGLGAVPALTLKSWILQNYGAGALPEIEEIERLFAVASPEKVQTSSRKLQSFRHPLKATDPVSAGKPLAPPVQEKPLSLPVPEEPLSLPTEQPLSPPVQEEPLSLPVPEEPLKPQPIPQPLSTPGQSASVEKVVAPEDLIKPGEYSELAGLSAAALSKKYTLEQIVAFLKANKAKVKDNASHRQAAAQLLNWLDLRAKTK